MSRALRLLPLTALVAASMSACGGSDSNSNASASTSGVVTGSYFEHAKVCIDANNNGKCDSGETSTYTDANGAYTLAGSGAITVEIGTDAFRNDPDKGTHTAITQPLVFRAPAGANAVVSAISTELAVLMDSNGGDINAAKTALAARLGVTIDKLLEDHNKETDAGTKAALQAEIDQAIALIADAIANGGDVGKSLRDGVAKRVALANNVKTIVVIYAENRGFDNLYGLFPGANGIPGVNPTSTGTAVAQKDFDGSVLPTLPPTWKGVTAAGQAVQVPQAQTSGWANKPFQIDDPAGINGTGIVVGQNVITRDLWHRFYQNQMQINGGKNDKFAAYADAGGLTMGYYDGSKMTMWNIAKQYTLADNFFMGAFGGSFLNHQYLVCACAPIYPNVVGSPADGSRATVASVDANGTPQLAPSASSVMAGSPTFPGDGNLTPLEKDGSAYAVNTMQPPYQPSGNAVASGNAAYADPTKATTLPKQSSTNIGDLLTARGVDWAWYAGAWNSALADAPNATRSVIYSGSIQFQPHHQPFNYFSRFDPATTAGAAERAAHLRDYDAAFLQDAAAGKLPPVTFYKPQGNLNQHPGYANVADGDAHIANVIAQLQKSPQWKNMVIVVTYDENGGFYDHATVPKADRWGPGTRIPAIVVSPFAKKGFVDHTQYDTASVLRLITHRFDLPTLPGIKQRDDALVSNGNKPMGDLTNALDFTQAQ
ncbi:acid phosphatase [Ralstonia sp. CHL-2022]|uniref:Acid phosphatase n=1 Tax=Ralstonia mojiangensis TaxID=2953895 RepID=A0ABT2LBY3_9RALS|nr:acid phosphatase [Ralstonia mojiangensis]MCT7298220.1 acid phosphatase [Ralstonia mojiangensis]MCT7312559.1 acid phosphatase [Ralstonia mojiangensis]